MTDIQDLLRNWNWLYFAEHNPALATALAVTLALMLAYGIYQLLVLVLRRQMGRGDFVFFDTLRRYCYKPGLITLLVFGLVLVLPLLPLHREWTGIVNRILALAQIFCVAWLAIRIVSSLREYTLRRYTEAEGIANVRIRTAYTQYKIFERLLVIAIVVLAIIFSLMTFDSFRRFGVSLLASAGVAGVIIGFAAQRTLGGLLAGIQIAIAQPIRIDDAVVVEGEWGRVEEITLTYVVIRIWDDRRLVVPVNYFIEKPFYNCTRHSDELIGSVILQLDLKADINDIRAFYTARIARHPLWDGREAKVQVVDVRDRVQEVRFLCSAANASDLFDLRCAIRELLLAYLAEEAPQSLPRNRVESFQPDGAHATPQPVDPQAHSQEQQRPA